MTRKLCPACNRPLESISERAAARKAERDAAAMPGKVAVLRHGKIHYRAKAGAPFDELSPSGQYTRLMDTELKAGRPWPPKPT